MSDLYDPAGTAPVAREDPHRTAPTPRVASAGAIIAEGVVIDALADGSARTAPSVSGGRGASRTATIAAAAAPDASDRALADFALAHPRLLVLTGAGCSTASGLGDYRDREGRWKRRQPITGQAFRGDPLARARYWARSAIGWPAFGAAEPGVAHHALAALQRLGRAPHLVTQNVDRLHQKAGHEGVVDLHGVLETASCTRCGHRVARDDFQRGLLARNPWLASADAAYAPDGDADLEITSADAIDVPDCERCGGLYKPDVVFFGENVPRETVALAMERLAAADALLVVGSSLMVFSGFRFCREAARRGQPIAIVNEGVTRADELATLKVGGDCGTRIGRLVDALGNRDAA